jgi:hypothetical protein
MLVSQKWERFCSPSSASNYFDLIPFRISPQNSIGDSFQWAEKGVRKEDQVLPALRRMERKNAYGVYFIYRSMEQGRTFRISVPKFPTKDPNPQQ